MNKQYLIILLFLLFSSCANDRKAQIEKMNFEELFNYFLNTQDSLEEERLVGLLDDSLGIYPYRFFYPYEKLDSVNNQISFEFKLSEEDYDYYQDYKIKLRNVFLIHIDRKNQIHAQKEKISSCDSVFEKMVKYIINENNEDWLPEKRMEIVELLDTIQVSKGSFIIISQSQQDSLMQRTDWLVIKKSIATVKKAYQQIRNNAAISYWNKNYSKLNLKQKSAISKLYPIYIWLYPNPTNLDWYALPKRIPRPPSPKVSEELLILIDDDEEVEILNNEK